MDQIQPLLPVLLFMAATYNGAVFTIFLWLLSDLRSSVKSMLREMAATRERLARLEETKEAAK